MTQISASVTVERGPFEMVPHWLLDHPDISAQALRLYCLLRRHGDKDGQCFPGRKRLAEQLHASPSTVDRAKIELLDAGAICQRHRTSEAGDWTSNEYHIHWDQATDCRRLKAPAGDEGSTAYDDTSTAYEQTGLPPAVNELIPNRNSDPITQTRAANADASAQPTEGQRINRLAKTYTDQVPLSNFSAVAGVVRKAVRANRYTDQQITEALGRLADDGRPVTADTLRIELEGMVRHDTRKSATRMYLESSQRLEAHPNLALAALGGAHDPR